ncbi:MAG: hypothetical protein WBC04_12390 [Candidatus Acidiferrales bacterium]
MTTANERAAEAADAEASRGIVCACTSEDVANLAELYYAALPWATPTDFRIDTAPDGSTCWMIFKDSRGGIRAAMMASTRNGSALALANPKDTDFALIREALASLAESVLSAFIKAGLTDVPISFPSSLHELGDALEQAGYAGKELLRTRLLHFSSEGRLQKRN